METLIRRDMDERALDYIYNELSQREDTLSSRGLSQYKGLIYNIHTFMSADRTEGKEYLFRADFNWLESPICILTNIMMEYLASDPKAIIVCEMCDWKRPVNIKPNTDGDPKKFYHGTRVYTFVGHEDDKEQVETALWGSASFWYSVLFFTRLPQAALSDQSDVDDDFMDALVANTKRIMVGAYDAEGWIICDLGRPLEFKKVHLQFSGTGEPGKINLDYRAWNYIIAKLFQRRDSLSSRLIKRAYSGFREVFTFLPELKRKGDEYYFRAEIYGKFCNSDFYREMIKTYLESDSEAVVVFCNSKDSWKSGLADEGDYKRFYYDTQVYAYFEYEDADALKIQTFIECNSGFEDSMIFFSKLTAGRLKGCQRIEGEILDELCLQTSKIMIDAYNCGSYLAAALKESTKKT